MEPPEPSSDRLWFWFAISSLACLAALAVSPVKDYFQEYRGYQDRFRELMFHRAGSLQEVRRARAQAAGIRQIWIPDFGGRVDRCITCHLGVEDPKMADAQQPFRLHPRTPHTPADFQRFGCVICHGGQGRATGRDEAHGLVPDWDAPVLPVRYTEAACGRCHEADAVPEASLLSAGRALMSRVGCYGCHKVAGHEDWRSEAPDLSGLGQKTSPAWLRAWLKSPRDLRPGTWMPDFRLTDDEIDVLVQFLWAQPPTASQDLGPEEDPPRGDQGRGKVLFSESRCISCHTVEGRGNGSAPELSGIGSKVNRRWLAAYLGNPHAFEPATRMPRYRFSRRDVLDLTEYLMEEFTDPSAPAAGPPLRPAQRSFQDGEATYKKYGCAGCHRIAGRSDPVQTGPDLTGIGEKPASLLDFGRRDDLPRRLPEWLAAKVSQPRSFRDGLKMPDFGFTEADVGALVTALLSLPREEVPERLRDPAPRPRYAPPGRFGVLVSEYRCLSCHQVGGAGEDISTAPLEAEGSRVRRDWLKRYLLLPITLRPVLAERMIPLRMPEAEAAFMADFMDNVYRDNGIPDEIFPAGPPADQVERGRKLFFERYGCQACHMVGGKGGYYGPLLDGAGERLRSGWIFWWLRGPQRWRADVREPDYGLDETDARDLAAYVGSIPAPKPAAGRAASGDPSRSAGSPRAGRGVP
ncbi:MAG: c-type cytochrome [Acidobacteria bacterium]|nr:c-type cytochrome [Acidobacteriota bacterium]